MYKNNNTKTKLESNNKENKETHRYYIKIFSTFS